VDVHEDPLARAALEGDLAHEPAEAPGGVLLDRGPEERLRIAEVRAAAARERLDRPAATALEV
jgi:hypothetical protein